MTTFTPTSTLAGISHAVASESSSVSINVIPPVPDAITDLFFHGILRAEGTDTTFSTAGPWTVTFASTDVSAVQGQDRVYAADSDGRLLFGDVAGVVGGTVTVTGWYQNEQSPIVSTIPPSNGSKTVINVKPVQLSYTVGGNVYVPVGIWRYEPGQVITFHTHAIFPYPRYAGSFRWDMGDGTLLKGQSVTHSYNTPSAFRRAVVSVLDDEGHEHVVGQQIYVLIPGAGPILAPAIIT